MNIRSILGATCAAVAIATATPAAAHDAGETITPHVEQAIPNIPGKSLVALVVDYTPGGASPSHTHAKSATPAQRREITVVGRGTADVTASALSIPSSKRGLETSTRPWSAPVGHRQPRAADVPTSASQQSLDEDANVDRKINSVCRGC
jgi:hypothetical protein